MRQPESLKAGDTIGILSTARKITREEIKHAINILENWGLKVVTGQTLGLTDNQYAGTDRDRLLDLQHMLDDVNIKAIICARGGYGTVRIIDRLDFRKFIHNPKWIVGYSDITVIHSHIHNNIGIPTLHATMALNFPDPNITPDKYQNTEEALMTLKKALFGENIEYSVGSHPFNRQGEATGILTGGNLSVLYGLFGSASDIDTTDKILILEDLDEYLYHIDRMMINFKRAGKLNRLAGLIIGGLTEMKDNDIPFGKNAEEIVREAVGEYDYPVCFGFPVGHIPDNRAMKLGVMAKLIVKDEGTYFIE